MPRVIRTSASVNPKFSFVFRQGEKVSAKVNAHFTLSLCERVEFVSKLKANLQIRERGATHVALLVNVGNNFINFGKDWDAESSSAWRVLFVPSPRERIRERGLLKLLNLIINGLPRRFAPRNDALKIAPTSWDAELNSGWQKHKIGQKDWPTPLLPRRDFCTTFSTP